MSGPAACSGGAGTTILIWRGPVVNQNISSCGYERTVVKENMLSILRTWKYLINVLFLLIAIGLEVFYSVCAGSCSYLRGDIFGLNLTYVGVTFALILIGLSLLKQDQLLLVLLSAAVGVEVVLVAFQVRKDVYCPYCLGFAAIILLLFGLNFDVRKKWLIIGSVALGFALFALFFNGSVTPTLAAANGVASEIMSRLI